MSQKTKIRDLYETKKPYGYHKTKIRRGELGKLSKIQEELSEAFDAENQKNPVMLILELSDMIGAIDAYLQKHHPTISLDDLITMAKATKRAFDIGARHARSES